MNGYLLLLDQEKSSAINGKNPSIAKMMGVLQKIGLSAPDGAIISFEINFKPSAINCNIPSTFPAYNGPVLNCILARNFLSTKMVVAAINAAYMNPGNTAALKISVWIRKLIIGIVRVGSTIIDKKR